MNKEIMTFSDKQPQYAVCASGRVMVCLNEREVKTIEQVPVSMDTDGEMEYQEQEQERTQYEYDVYWLDSVESNTEGAVLQAAIASVIAEIVKYDESSEVNGFELNGATVWLDKATRVGLMNSTTISKAAGLEKTTLWLGDDKIEVECDKAIQLLSALEMYALECFNVTAAHKKAVSELESIEEVMAYDYRKGYPDKLKMSV